MFDTKKKLKLFRRPGIYLIPQGIWATFVIICFEPERICGIIIMWSLTVIGIFLLLISFESIFLRLSKSRRREIKRRKTILKLEEKVFTSLKNNMNKAFTIQSILSKFLINESSNISEDLVRDALNNLVEKEKIRLSTKKIANFIINFI